MLALIRMDWTLNRRILLQLAPLFALWSALVFLQGLRGLLTASFGWAALGMLVPVFQNARDSIEPFLLALPVTRGQVVAARYLVSLSGLALALLAFLLVGGLGHRLGFAWAQEILLPDLLAGLGLQGWLLATLLCLYLPFHFRFGGEVAGGIFAGTLAAGLAPLVLLWGFQGLAARTMLLLDRVLAGGHLLPGAAAGLLLQGVASFGLSLLAFRRRGLQAESPAALPVLWVAALLGLLALALG